MTMNEASKFIELMGGVKCRLPYNEGQTRSGKVEPYFYNGFCLYFSGTYYFVISGRFPAKIADEISKRAIELNIRIDGGCEDWTVESRITHDRLKCLKYDWSNVEECTANYKRIREDVIINDYENCYVETYHIDTVDGLKYVLDVIKENKIKTEWFTESFK